MIENHSGESPTDVGNRFDNTKSRRKRSRPVVKKSISYRLKRNKIASFLIFLIVLVAVVVSVYVIINKEDASSNSNSESSYLDDPAFISAVSGSNYPIAVLNTSKGIVAVELYDDKMPKTCENFINLVKDGFYDGMIFHRISDNFMIQTGNTFPDGSTKESPYGNIDFEISDIKHVDGAISMASTAAKEGGSAQFFICDDEQSFLDDNYAAFGKTIYGISVVRDIANDPHDNSSPAGGGHPYSDIIINEIIILND
jgi:peptidyl-prolyl cis-trans isomerase B (cyclophilin B)